jgi:Mrp family chromosome partitioning ATPase
MRVALVDADFENPQLAQQLRVNPTCGWHDTVTARLPLTEAAVASTRDNVTLLPLRVASVAQADAAVDPVVVTELIDRLSRAFDLVIFDMEPVEPGETVESGETDELDVRAPAAAESPTAATRLHQALAALLVYDASSSEQQLADSIAQLRSAGIETLGAVENFFAPGAAS